MANEALDSFLASETQAASPEPAPREAPEPRQEAPEPKAEATRQPEPKAPEKPPEDDDEPSERLDHDGKSYIPQQVLERERKRRQDWKEKAARLEGELAAYKAQQEQARQPQPEQMPPLAPIDPAQDPVGFTARLQQVLLNERLNNSEERLREKIGDEKLNEYVNEFKQLAQRDQTLFGKLYSQTNPYAWMTREVDRLRHLREVGDDPSAYRARIEAEARAKWEAEAAAKPPPPSPAAGMQPSLATARSVAGRTASTWTGEPSLEEVLAPVQNRRSANGQFRRF
jgi:hypothetical protein